MTGLVIVLVALLAQRGAAPPTTEATPMPASVSGIVVKLSSGDAAAGARVQLFPESPAIAPPGSAKAVATAADNGQFSFDHLTPGTYWIAASLQGHLPAEYGQRSPTGTGIPLTLAPGQKVSNIRIGLTPTGSMTGRIVDEDGEPVPRVQVQALRSVYRNGQRVQTITQSVLSDDRGAYRLFWLPPGEYRISALPVAASDQASATYITQPRRFSTYEQGVRRQTQARTLESGEVLEETYVPVYYPGTTDEAMALPVEVGAGASVTGIDLAVTANRARTYHIRGVTLGISSQPSASVDVRAVPRVATGPSVAILSALSGADGAFDIQGVLPGSYYVVEQAGGIVPIEVVNADVDNVVVATSTGFTIPVKITFDDNGSAKMAPTLLLQLQRDPDVLGMMNGDMMFGGTLGQGQMALNAVTPGDYRLSVPPFLNLSGTNVVPRPRPPDLEHAYVKSMRLASLDVLADGLHLWSQPQGALEIVISANGATISGRVVDDRRQPAANVTVTVIPDAASRKRLDLYRSASTDVSGRFKITDVPAGDFSVLAWDDIEAGAWMNPEFLRPYENRGQFVRLNEGATENVELTLVTR